jgi:putative flippase GtrA
VGGDHRDGVSRDVGDRETAPRSRVRSYARELARFSRANVSSLFATGCDWFVVALLVTLGAHYLVVRPLGSFCGAIVDFTLKRHWAFRRLEKRPMSVESARYMLVSATSLVWTTACCALFVEVANMSVGSAVLASSIAVGATWNYPLHRLFVFAEP